MQFSTVFFLLQFCLSSLKDKNENLEKRREENKKEKEKKKKKKKKKERKRKKREEKGKRKGERNQCILGETREGQTQSIWFEKFFSSLVLFFIKLLFIYCLWKESGRGYEKARNKKKIGKKINKEGK